MFPNLIMPFGVARFPGGLLTPLLHFNITKYFSKTIKVKLWWFSSAFLNSMCLCIRHPNVL